MRCFMTFDLWTLTTYFSFLICGSCVLTKLSNLTRAASFLFKESNNGENPVLLRFYPNLGEEGEGGAFCTAGVG